MKFNRLSKVYLLLTFWFFISSIVSKNLNGIYYSIAWFEITLLGVLLGNSRHRTESVIRFYLFAIYLFTVAQIYIRDNLLTIFPPLDRVVVIVFFFALMQSKKTYRYFLIIFAVLSRSFSGLFSFFSSYMIVKYPRIVIAFIPLIGFMVYQVKLFLEDNIGLYLFYGKNAEHFLTGSGRFDLLFSVYKYVFEEPTLAKFFLGSGFMSERIILSQMNLAWSTDPHNEIVRAFLNYGLFGLILIYFLWKASLKFVGYTVHLRILIVSIVIFSLFNAVYGFKPLDIHIIVLFLSYQNIVGTVKSDRDYYGYS